MSDIIRRLKCNQPVKSESGGKKFVVKACQGGQERIVRFGDASMGHYREGRIGIGRRQSVYGHCVTYRCRVIRLYASI